MFSTQEEEIIIFKQAILSPENCNLAKILNTADTDLTFQWQIYLTTYINEEITKDLLLQ